MTKRLMTFLSASFRSSSESLSRAIRWSSLVFRRRLDAFLFLSFFVSPVSSSSCRSSSDRLLSPSSSLGSSLDRSPSRSCSDMLGPPSRPAVLVLRDGVRGVRGVREDEVEVWGWLKVRVLRRRRWPAGAMGSISISSERRPGVVVEDETPPPPSASRSILKLVVAEEADEGTEKSSKVVELGAARTLFTNWVGVVVVVAVVLVLVEEALCGTARESLRLAGYGDC